VEEHGRGPEVEKGEAKPLSTRLLGPPEVSLKGWSPPVRGEDGTLQRGVVDPAKRGHYHAPLLHLWKVTGPYDEPEVIKALNKTPWSGRIE
jgi:hypothetical protein